MINFIINNISEYYGNIYIFITYLACLVFLCFCGKKIRTLVVCPSIILTIIILNPLIYEIVWVKLIGEVYWRMLWMLPTIPVIACAILNVDSVIKNKYLTLIVSIGILGICFINNKNLYMDEDVFVEASNPYKLPSSTIKIGDCVLEIDKEPLGMVPRSQFSYLRQYNGKIRLLFGRNADKFIGIYDPDFRRWALIDMILANGGDTQKFVELARVFDTDFIVLPENHDFDVDALMGYTLYDNIEGHLLFVYTGE